MVTSILIEAHGLHLTLAQEDPMLTQEQPDRRPSELALLAPVALTAVGVDGALRIQTTLSVLTPTFEAPNSVRAPSEQNPNTPDVQAR